MSKNLPPLFIVADLAFTVLVYDSLPLRVATHFGVQGPNAWSGRGVAAWVLPAMTVGVWLLLKWIPRIDPRYANYAQFQESYDTIIAGVVGALVAIHVALLGYALGWPVSVERVVPVVVGGLFVLIGRILPRARPVWFFGIRTPWTLSNDEVWDRTQRVGGRLLMIAGLLLMTLSVVRTSWATWLVIVITGALIFFTLPYSYFVWRQVTRAGGRPPAGPPSTPSTET